MEIINKGAGCQFKKRQVLMGIYCRGLFIKGIRLLSLVPTIFECNQSFLGRNTLSQSTFWLKYKFDKVQILSYLIKVSYVQLIMHSRIWSRWHIQISQWPSSHTVGMTSARTLSQYIYLRLRSQVKENPWGDQEGPKRFSRFTQSLLGCLSPLIQSPLGEATIGQDNLFPL